SLLEHGIEIDEYADEVGALLLQRLASLEWRADRERQAQKPLFVPFQGWAAGNRSAARWLKLCEETSIMEDIRDMAGLTREVLEGIRQPTLAIYGQHSRCLKTFEAL